MQRQRAARAYPVNAGATGSTGAADVPDIPTINVGPDVSPTATHHDEFTHDTENRWSAGFAGSTLGLGTVVHVLPSQLITNVRSATIKPTATQDDAVTHDTEFK